MRISDLIALILDNLGRRKARVALTAVGVVIGTAAVVVLVSLGVGLRRILDTRLTEDSVLSGPDADPAAVQHELDRVEPWLPLAALRFSRAF